MENSRFEDSFKDAFKEAEILPSTGVWTNIELGLEKTSGSRMKRNLLMLQLLAAASVAFAFGIGALYYLHIQPAKQNISTRPLDKQHALPPSDDLAEKSTELKFEQTVDRKARRRVNKNHKSNLDVKQGLNEQRENSRLDFKVARPDLSSFIQLARLELILPKQEEHVGLDAGMLLLARLKDEEKKYLDEDKKTAGSAEKIWASVGFGAGSYNPNVQSSYNLNKASPSESSAGFSYSVGVSVASKISSRFILQGGVSYLAQSADFTSTTSYEGTAASLKEYEDLANDEIASSPYITVDSYTVASSLQFVSIPVQAGYILIDRDFGIQLNGGVATDLFIRNTLSSENDNYQTVTQSAGKDSPYRTVNFSGLLGTEFSYRIADHYRISLNPGLRYSLNSIYKDEIAATSTPVTFDVSLRFRYIFK